MKRKLVGLTVIVAFIGLSIELVGYQALLVFVVSVLAIIGAKVVVSSVDNKGMNRLAILWAGIVGFLFLSAGPVTESCTDWKAIAAFDALILENDRTALAEERSPDVAAVVEKQCDRLQRLMDAEKDPNIKNKRMTQWSQCHAAETAYQNALTDLSLDREHALADQCQEAR